MNIARTTITIKPSLLARLRLFAHHHNRTVSEVVEQGIERVLAETDRGEIDKLYQEVFKLEGIATTDDPKYKNKTVDEILYGEDGAWRGSEQ
jgi:hypothetical protein